MKSKDVNEGNALHSDSFVNPKDSPNILKKQIKRS